MRKHTLLLVSLAGAPWLYVRIGWGHCLQEEKALLSREHRPDFYVHLVCKGVKVCQSSSKSDEMVYPRRSEEHARQSGKIIGGFILPPPFPNAKSPGDIRRR